MSVERPLPSIEEIELPAGAVKLTRPERPAGPEGRQPARIITMVWGDRYIADLLAMTIPALLAPGNLPAFVEHFDSELVIVTETRLFDTIARSAVISRVLSHCDVRLVPVDDLLSSWYGITLTYALVRGFADLGEAMIGAHLVFLNADFIVADGSYTKLAEAILRGERLVVSPSYCMVQEETVGLLRSRYDPRTHALSIGHRDMASIIISHRHNTIRAKTVNQQLFRIHRYDQFYWHVDEHTLLCRQMPIAVVYMQPERVLTEMPTFWDYGVVSEYCPTATPCVLGDSDDFLMAELRTEGTFAELLHLGWPDAEEIAADLSSFTTKDHHDYGRHTLVLHSADLPATLDAGKAALAAFVDQVYARLTPPISYLDHPFWATAFPRFLAAHLEQKTKRETRDKALAALRQRDAGADQRHREIAALKRRIRGLSAVRGELETSMAARRVVVEAEIVRLERDYLDRRRALEESTAACSATTEGDADRVVKKLAELEDELAMLVAVEAREIDELCGVASPAVEIPRRAAPVGAGGGQADPAPPIKAQALAVPQQTASSLPARLYYRMFGQLPRTTVWHPYHAVIAPTRAAIKAADTTGDILLISSGSTLGPLLIRDAPGRKLSITPQMALTGLYSDVIGDRRRFQLCVCDLAFDDLFSLRQLLDNIRPLLAKQARIVVFHHNNGGRQLDGSTYGFTRGAFPLFGTSRISFAGSRASIFAARLFERTLNRPAGGWALPRLALTLALAAPFARFAAYREARRWPRRLPRHCTSMTIEIET